jgi:hypothetical protein
VSNILQSLNRTVIAGIILAIILFILMYSISGGWQLDTYFWSAVFRYLHVLSGIMWIGLLYYFNFVQIPNMPNIPDEQKPAIGKVIAPAALFWFTYPFKYATIRPVIIVDKAAHLNQKRAAGAITFPIAGFCSSGILGILGIWTKLK